MEAGGRSELLMESFVVHGLSNEAVDRMDVGGGRDSEKPTVRVMVEPEVPLDPGAYAGYLPKRTACSRCEDLLLLPVRDEWSLSPLRCHAPHTKLSLV